MIKKVKGKKKMRPVALWSYEHYSDLLSVMALVPSKTMFFYMLRVLFPVFTEWARIHPGDVLFEAEMKGFRLQDLPPKQKEKRWYKDFMELLKKKESRR